MAPEILERSPFTQKADVFSFGCVLWELVSRKIPWHDQESFDIAALVVKGERPAIPKDCPSKFAQIMSACWSGNPSKRPTMKQLTEDLSKLAEEHHLYIS
jgi:serine/threonine protein kinase